MKKLFLLLALGSGFFVTSYAQTVFAPPGATWTYSYSGWNFDFTGSWNIWGAYQIRYEKDTLVNNKEYKLLRSNSVFYSERFDNRRIELTDKLLIRQQNDTIYAFRRFNEGENQEDIYFIFLEKPDSIEYCDPLTALCDKVYIDSIKTTEIGRRALKTWIGKSYVPFLPDGYSYDTFPLEFIERLGPVNDLFEYFGFRGHPISSVTEVTLHCYSDDEWGEINLSGTPCNLVLSTATLSSSSVTWNCFVNGNNLHFEIQSKLDKGLQIQLFDLQGKHILTRKIGESTVILLPENLSSGIYIVRLVDHLKGLYDAKKIFIMNP